MTNPDPNVPPDLRRDSRRHAGPLIGMVLVVLFAVGLIFYWLAEESAQAPSPTEETETPAPPAAEGESAVEGDGTIAPAPDTAPDTAPVDPAPDLAPDAAPDTAPDVAPGTTTPTTPPPAD